jgi:transcriptional repressor NrdR
VNCPGCDHDATKVLESRVPEAGDTIRRRRECLECSFRFTTYERVEQPVVWVVKHDGSRQQFAREKLLRGLVRACSKRDIGTERLEALVIEIESQLRDGGGAHGQRVSHAGIEVTSDELGERALEGLAQLDHVAYVRFASVYRAFEDVAEFQRELERLGERHPASSTTNN